MQSRLLFREKEIERNLQVYLRGITLQRRLKYGTKLRRHEERSPGSKGWMERWPGVGRSLQSPWAQTRNRLQKDRWQKVEEEHI